MIKKLIFDLDNTLIKWEDEYNNAIKYALDDVNIKYDDMLISKIEKAVDEYETYYDIYDKNLMHQMFEKYTDMKLPHSLIDRWIYHLEKCVPKRDLELEKTLEYLSKKYELVVLTNWFTLEQQNRLKNYNILKYFNKVIGTDNIKNKPNKESFLYACHPFKPNECVMIGDDLQMDINGAKIAGLKTIYLGVDIKNINELRREPWN